ncbi:nuclear transport factor 2 family protein [Telmatocola sphagniphila]|uniref:Nuclear transport factor 2 family protein n=1 Tax=Telmatocola sphagniphila TaxID=1123043 RepID=A0A8E6B3X0_9BACT|nr:nuclear transport factor 2 family protein [Telmatocola sphagniphila]QVL30093.1 nuclear transport factor 2 family protein [Telmatocola sphagniphila]
MVQSECRDLILQYIAAYNCFDVDAMLALMTEDVNFRNISGGQVTATASGKAELRKLAEQTAKLFHEREQQVIGIEFRGNAAIASIKYRGLLASDITGLAVAGTWLELQGLSEFIFSGARIASLVDRS